MSKKLLLALGIVLLLSALVVGGFKLKSVLESGSQDRQSDSSGQTETAQNEDQASAEAEAEQQEPAEQAADTDKTPSQAPVEKPASSCVTPSPATADWVINKQRPLNPRNYTPPNLAYPSVKRRTSDASMQLRCDVAAAVEKLFAGATSAGHSPMLSSGYRSYQTQVSVYNRYVANDGQAAADTYSARPGHSEHQTGLAFDICNASGCSLEQSFANTPLGQWVAAHAHEYGFTIRYPKDGQHITGYTYEPWHLRYVGPDLAGQLHQSGKTLEEHFGLPAAPGY